ncbi:MAG: alanine-tRNA synthetase second additional domain-containing protein [Oscillospiraceae bacterium]|nr:alanine-tRNA synthetase second additional domain-containing protein [Oscillospiraceae bacterium]
MHQTQTSHILSSYFAPRGHGRMYSLGMQIAQLYLSPFDKLIGIIGEAGSGKSALIRGMFPGLELTNDDNGVYVRPLPLLDQETGWSLFTPHTYHVDIRFETGFTQLSALIDAILEALRRGKRVIVEHFDLIYEQLGMNADLLIGVGEEVVITRPTLFGPKPKEIYDRVYASLPYRLMSHSAEDLCELFIPKEELERCGHDDVHHGFVLTFPDHPPAIDLVELERKAHEMIAADLPITYKDENHVCIGDTVHRCTGPRIHVSSTGQIKDFYLVHRFLYDALNKRYLLVGCLGKENLDKLRHQ